MARVVQKYGGSSVSDLEKLGQVADRIAAAVQEGHQVVVVVSAMGNTTNELLGLAGQVSQRPDRRELDMLISVGERISMALLAMALRERGIAARSLTGSQSGIITDESHADAKVVEVRAARVLQHLEAGEVVIVAGFQGVSRQREVTTLGRGGSDTTAVVLAAAIEADWCEICSDVDGVWSADPRVVPEARKLEGMSLDEAVALARGGAKVLFEDAVKYARQQGVALHASATAGPGSGTRIGTSPSPRDGASAVTGDGQLRRVRLGQTERIDDLRRMSEAGVRVRRVLGNYVWVDMRTAHGGMHELGRAVDEGPVGMITAVGPSLAERAEKACQATDALVNAACLPTASGGSGDVLWWEVPVELVDTGTRAVHDVLVGR